MILVVRRLTAELFQRLWRYREKFGGG